MTEEQPRNRLRAFTERQQKSDTAEMSEADKAKMIAKCKSLREIANGMLRMADAVVEVIKQHNYEQAAKMILSAPKPELAVALVVAVVPNLTAPQTAMLHTHMMHKAFPNAISPISADMAREIDAGNINDVLRAAIEKLGLKEGDLPGDDD